MEEGEAERRGGGGGGSEGGGSESYRKGEKSIEGVKQESEWR